MSCEKKLFSIKQYFISYGITIFFLQLHSADSMKIIIGIKILKSSQIKGTLSMDLTGWHIVWTFSFDFVTYLSHFTVELFFFLLKINILFCISWLLRTQISGKDNYSIFLYSGQKSSTQPPTLFWDRTYFRSISLSIQKKLFFNQKIIINKEKYFWGICPIPN